MPPAHVEYERARCAEKAVEFLTGRTVSRHLRAGLLLEEALLAQPGDGASLWRALVEEAQELGDVGEGAEGLPVFRKLTDPERQGDEGGAERVQPEEDPGESRRRVHADRDRAEHEIIGGS